MNTEALMRVTPMMPQIDAFQDYAGKKYTLHLIWGQIIFCGVGEAFYCCFIISQFYNGKLLLNILKDYDSDECHILQGTIEFYYDSAASTYFLLP